MKFEYDSWKNRASQMKRTVRKGDVLQYNHLSIDE